MSKEEVLKIQKCVLKVNIHCDGCKQKVKKILQKIDGVFTTEIDAEAGKVTVSGNIDPNVLIKKLAKSGKHAEIWGAPKGNQQNQMNLMKNMQMDSGKGGSKAQKGVNNQSKAGNNQPKNGGGQTQMQNLQQQQQQLQRHLQQLQQLEQMKGLQDLTLPPQFKDLKLQGKDPGPNQKKVKFNLPNDDDMSDDEFDSDDDYDDDDLDDEMDDVHLPPSKMKPFMGNGQGGNVMNGNQLLNALKNGNNGGAGGGGKKGSDVGPVLVQMSGMGGGNGQNQGGNGGKKGGGGGQNNQNQGGGGKNGGKSGDGKGGNNGCGSNSNKKGCGGGGGNGNNVNNGGKKGGGVSNLPAMAVGGGPHAGLPGPKFAQMGDFPRGHVDNIPAVQGVPASRITGGGYFPGSGPESIAGNHYQQQQMLAAMMNQQQAMASNQAMMYARPPPAVNYMPPPYPYPYPYPHQHPPVDQYSDMFSDENTSGCVVM